MANLPRTIKELYASPLARGLLLGFFLLALVESSLIGSLLFEINGAERAAAREYAFLKASEELSDSADLIRRHRRVVDANRFRPWTEASMYAVRQSAHNVIDGLQEYRAAALRANLNPRSVATIISTIEEGLQFSADMYAPGRSRDERKVAYSAYINAFRHMYGGTLVELRNIHRLLDTKVRVQQAGNQLVFVILIFNVVICAVLALLVQRNISGPLSRLASSCARLKTAQIIPAPARVTNEIELLEQTFHDMSEKLHRNEQARRSYIQLFKEIQGESLTRVRDFLARYIGMPSSQTLGGNTALLMNVDGMLHLLNGMAEGLSFNQDEAPQLEVAEVESRRLFERAGAAVKHLLDNKRIVLEVECPVLQLSVDENLIGRVITNLLSNACKFSGASTIIVLRGVDKPDSFLCEVVDQGPGVSEEDRAQLFKRFSQLESAQKRAGSGLGLLICKQIIEAHGGSIGCNSEVGKGSTFWFEIPKRVVPSIGASSRSASLAQVRKPASIKATFLALLVVFLSFQFFIAFQLNGKLKEASVKAAAYAEQKILLVDIQELLALFLTWRQRAADAVKSNDPVELAALFPLLEEQAIKVHRLVGIIKEPELSVLFRELQKRIRLLYRIGRIGLQGGDQISVLQRFNLVQLADDTGMETENLFFRALSVDRNLLGSSYDLSSKLMTEISQLLFVVASVNFVLLMFVLALTIAMLKRIARLSKQAEQFSAGGTPTPALKGADELAYLDGKLCEVAGSIRQAEVQRQELMAVVNHDLRTPLCSVLLGFEMLSVRGELEANQQHQAIACDTQLRALLRQINDLLDIERIESGKLIPDQAEIVLSELLELSIDQVKQAYPGRVIELVVAEELEDRTVQGELALLDRAFGALLDNALRYSASDQPVTVRLGAIDERAVVEITDHGPGIQPELANQLFERYRFFAGKALTGMGLPLAHRIFTLHRADLQLSPSPSAGTIATVQF